MTTPTVEVTVTLAAQDGTPYEGVTVRARLDANEVYEGIVISDSAEAVTDADGVAILDLFPNAPSPTGLGTQGSTYSVRATIPGGRGLNVNARVPNTACRLENILVQDATVALDDAELALLQAQSAVTTAASSAAAAAASQSAAAASALSADEDAQQTGDDRAAVEAIATDFGDVATAVGEAEASAEAAGASASAAAASAGAVTGALSQSVARRLREIIDSAYPFGFLPQRVVVEKLRSDYPEFAVYTPITQDGIEWTRWYVTNRQNTGNSGSPRAYMGTKALLYSTEAIASASENQTTGTEGQSPTDTQDTTDGSTTGTWTAAGSVGGVTDIRHSTTIGDKVEYTVTGCERLLWRTYRNVSNGGVVKVAITESAVEIASGLYCVPLNGGDRTIDLRYNTGQYFVPLAEGLNPALTYVVTITVHSSNPVSGRGYDGGMRLYDETEFDATGRHGSWPTTSLASVSPQANYDPGGRVVYAFTGTKVSWNYIRTSTGGIAQFKVFDSTGVEIDGGNYEETSIDTYSGSGSFVDSVVVASGLEADTYYLHVTNSPTKNASATGYRLHDRGGQSWDEEVPGIPGTDAFDIQRVSPTLIGGDAALPDGVMFFGTGNLELAIRCRRTTDATDAHGFVGGTHGRENAPTGLTYMLDGEVIDFAGAAVNTIWVGTHFSLAFTTTLQYGSGATGDSWATVPQTLRWSPSGYHAEVQRTTTASVVIYDDYTLMVMVPSSDSTGVYANKGCGGPFERWAVDADATYTVDSHNDTGEAIDVYSRGVVAYNDSYAVYGYNSNEADARAAYQDVDGSLTSITLALLQDRSDGSGKYYNRAFRYDSTNGRAISSGDTLTRTNHYRVVKLAGLEALLAS